MCMLYICAHVHVLGLTVCVYGREREGGREREREREEGRERGGKKEEREKALYINMSSYVMSVTPPPPSIKFISYKDFIAWE